MDLDKLKTLFWGDVFQEMAPVPGSDGRYHGLYVIQNQIDYKFYVGKHSSKKTKDKYFGSGKDLNAAIALYGKDSFKIKYFHWADNAKQLHDDETDLINLLIDEIFDGNWTEVNKAAYNLCRNKGYNGVSNTTRQKMRDCKLGEKNYLYGVVGNKNPSFKGYYIGYTDTSLIICAGKTDLLERGFTPTHISGCITGRRKSSKGYKWDRTLDKSIVSDLLAVRCFSDDVSAELYNQM